MTVQPLSALVYRLLNNRAVEPLAPLHGAHPTRAPSRPLLCRLRAGTPALGIVRVTQELPKHSIARTRVSPRSCSASSRPCRRSASKRRKALWLIAEIVSELAGFNQIKNPSPSNTAKQAPPPHRVTTLPALLSKSASLFMRMGLEP